MALVRPAATTMGGGAFREENQDRRHYSTTLSMMGKVPTTEQAASMKAKMSEMENDTLLTIAHMGNHDAGCEVLKRHIMVVDDVDYEQACATFTTIEAENQKDLFGVFPYFVGIGVAGVAAFGSLPMVFDLGLAEWFNEYYVTTDVPEPKDLETALEVGSWTWNWMEPPLGTLSFALLCLQFARAQIKNLGLHPYTKMLVRRRARSLAKAFPQYDPELIYLYSESEPLVNNLYGN